MYTEQFKINDKWETYKTYKIEEECKYLYYTDWLFATKFW